jgi:hypothetical protein
MIEAADHPLVKRYVEASKRLNAVALAAAEKLEQIANALPRNCPLPDGFACACTGACLSPQYHEILSVASDLRSASNP